MIRTLIAVAISLATALPAAAQMKHGFRSYKWGDPPPKDSVYLAPSSDGGEMRRLPSEPLAIGDVKLDILVFYYWKGGLTTVQATLRRPRALETILKEKWGGGVTSASVPDGRVWGLESNGKSTRASLFWNTDETEGRFMIQSQDALDRQEADAKARARKAKGL